MKGANYKFWSNTHFKAKKKKLGNAFSKRFSQNMGKKPTTVLKRIPAKTILRNASSFPCEMKQLSLLKRQSIFVVFPKKRTEDKLFFLDISISCSDSDIELLVFIASSKRKHL